MGSLICRVELNKKEGVTITVEDKTGNVTQTVEMTGEMIKVTHKPQEAEELSTITANSEGVSIKCKAFSVDAESVTVTSSKATSLTAEETFDVKATKALTAKTDDAMTLEATNAFKAKGKDATVEAPMGATKVSGKDVTVSATLGLNLEGNQSKLEGKSSADVKGLTAKLEGTVSADVDGKLTTVNGQMTNVKGSLIKLG